MTADIVGVAESIMIALLAPNELAAAGAASVRLAEFPAPSKIVPLFKARAFVLS